MKENNTTAIIEDGVRVDLYISNAAKQKQIHEGFVKNISLRGFDAILYAVSEDETAKIRKGLGTEYSAVIGCVDVTGQKRNLRIHRLQGDGMGKNAVRGTDHQVAPYEISCGSIPGKYRFQQNPNGEIMASDIPDKYFAKYHKFEEKYKFKPVIIEHKKEKYIVDETFFVVGGKGVFLLKRAGEKQKVSVKVKSGALLPVTLSDHLNIYPTDFIRVKDPIKSLAITIGANDETYRGGTVDNDVIRGEMGFTKKIEFAFPCIEPVPWFADASEQRKQPCYLVLEKNTGTTFE